MTKNPLSFVTKIGAEIASVLEALAQLRITVFRDYPYLYEGTIEYEKRYLQTYVQSKRAFLFAVYDGENMVGATTCIPLSDETDEVRQPFEDAGLNVDAIFYFGESILLPQYRGMGLGHRFFDERERYANHFGVFDMTCFCAVVRADNHFLKPINYRPNDVFWLKRGYLQQPTLQSVMEWTDIHETVATYKKMIYWSRNL
jgi:GNAT superfamily N-acetyltransferase